MGGGGSALSDVRRDSGGDIRPEIACPVDADQPDEYGGGGPLEYIEEGLTTAVAIGGAEV
jgi:hypothetical protein